MTATHTHTHTRWHAFSALSVTGRVATVSLCAFIHGHCPPDVPDKGSNLPSCPPVASAPSSPSRTFTLGPRGLWPRPCRQHAPILGRPEGKQLFPAVPAAWSRARWCHNGRRWWASSSRIRIPEFHRLLRNVPGFTTWLYISSEFNRIKGNWSTNSSLCLLPWTLLIYLALFIILFLNIKLYFYINDYKILSWVKMILCEQVYLCLILFNFLKYI